MKSKIEMKKWFQKMKQNKKGIWKMNFNNKNEMKMIAAKGDSIGKWMGTSVFVCSVEDLAYRGSGAYYVLYDDENKIVGSYMDIFKVMAV